MTNINTDNDLLIRSLAQLAGDPEADQEHTETAEFALALRRLKTDPAEAARIAEIARDVAPSDDALPGFDTSGTDDAARPDTPPVRVTAGADAYSIVVNDGGHLDIHNFGPGMGTPERAADAPAPRDPVSTGNGEGRAITRLRPIIGRVDGFMSVLVLAACATLLTLFAAMTLPTAIISTTMTVASIIPVLLRSWTNFATARRLRHQGEAWMVLKEMREGPAELKSMAERH